LAFARPVLGFTGSKGAALRGPGHRNHRQTMRNQTLFNTLTLDGFDSDWSPNCTNGIVMQRKRKQIDQSTDFHAILLAERNLIVSGPDGGLELLTSSEGLAVDDQAPLLHEQFVALRQRGMNRRKLNLIDAALERLDHGDFGECQACGQDIPPKRLNVIPWAAHCVACQERLEREGSLDAPALMLVA
jgi:RNA polymerase-binding protein DksA